MEEETPQGPADHPKPTKSGARKRKQELIEEGEGAGAKKPRSHNEYTWACPFFKLDHDEYRDCGKCKLTRPSDVTQHVQRKHMQPIHCPRCGDIFKTVSERDTHIRQKTCPLNSFSLPGATNDQLEACRRNRGLDVPEAKCQEERGWYGKYADLFGDDVRRPASPYILSNRGIDALFWSFIEEGHLDRFAHEIAPFDNNLLSHLRQFHSHLQTYLIDPLEYQSTMMTQTPAAVPRDSELPAATPVQPPTQPPAPSPGPVQHAPDWPDFGSGNLESYNFDTGNFDPTLFDHE